MHVVNVFDDESSHVFPQISVCELGILECKESNVKK